VLCALPLNIFEELYKKILDKVIEAIEAPANVSL